MLFRAIKKMIELMVLTRRFEAVSCLDQVVDIVRIIFGGYNIGKSDYYSQRIYHIFRTEPERVRDYLGWRYQAHISYLLNERTGITAGWDKLTFEYLMRARGLPTPPLKAVYKPGGAGLAAVHDMKDRHNLAAYLRTPAPYPFYLKAAYSKQGKNSHACQNYHPETDSICTTGDNMLKVETLIEEMIRKDGPDYRTSCGWLCQDILQPHPIICHATGSKAISSARIVLFRDEQSLHIPYCVWRIAGDRSHNDNFNKGRNGNWLALIDAASGQVLQPKCAPWPYAADPEMKTHPIARLDGLILPDWDLALEYVKTASSTFPLMKIQHWDVALTDQGPVLLEVNDLGGLPQIHCQGIIDDRVRRIVRDICANPAYPHTKTHKKWVSRI